MALFSVISIHSGAYAVNTCRHLRSSRNGRSHTFQQFWSLSLPFIAGIEGAVFATLYLTNKFDDIFLLMVGMLAHEP